MPERLTITPESQEASEARIEAPEQHKALPEHAETEAQIQAAQQAEQARNNIEQNAETVNPIQKLEAAQKAEEAPQNTTVNRELKQITLRRELKNIQHKLPAQQKALSRVIHQPAIRAVSEAAGKSISRPSGLLGGGIMAFVGTSAYLYLTKHVGFSYNYFVFFLLFVAGFALGLILELVIWTLTTRHRHAE